MTSTIVQQDRASLRKILIPLALAQFICSFAGSNMNVMINDIKTDLNTTIQAVQVCITLFLLVMSALMIPGGKLTDKFGRKRCFITGLTIYGLGALISAVAPSIGVLAVGYSLFLGVGTALLIPPVYILVTILFRDLKSRAWAFGVVSGMGGIGAAAGPLIGGAIATAISWRAAFVFQAIIVALIVLAARGLVDPLPADPDRPFDVVGAILSALGLVLLVGGIMAADSNLALMAILMAAGAIILAGFFAWIRSRERAGKEVLLSTSLFRNRTSNLGMVTQNVQWAMLLGSAFAVSAYLQVVRHYNSIQVDAHRGRLRGSHRRHDRAGRHGARQPQSLVLRPGTVPDGRGRRRHGHPLGQRRAVRLPGEPAGRDLRAVAQHLQPGSSLGTAIAGTILVAGLGEGNQSYGYAIVVLACMGLVGLVAAILIPRAEIPAGAEAPSTAAGAA
jgi:MFS family permease